MLFMAAVMLIAACFGYLILPILEQCCPSIGIANIEVTQIIDNYFKAVDDHDRNWSVQEELNSRENLCKMQTLTNSTLEKF